MSVIRRTPISGKPHLTPGGTTGTDPERCSVSKWPGRTMTAIALKMLVGDRAKYFGIIMGITFASLLITQQAAIFVGLMTRTYSSITDLASPTSG